MVQKPTEQDYNSVKRAFSEIVEKPTFIDNVVNAVSKMFITSEKKQTTFSFDEITTGQVDALHDMTKAINKDVIKISHEKDAGTLEVIINDKWVDKVVKKIQNFEQVKEEKKSSDSTDKSQSVGSKTIDIPKESTSFVKSLKSEKLSNGVDTAWKEGKEPLPKRYTGDEKYLKFGEVGNAANDVIKTIVSDAIPDKNITEIRASREKEDVIRITIRTDSKIENKEGTKNQLVKLIDKYTCCEEDTEKRPKNKLAQETNKDIVFLMKGDAVKLANMKVYKDDADLHTDQKIAREHIKSSSASIDR